MAPRLYILSRPAVAEGLATYLAHQSQDWPQEHGTPAEQLIAFAARHAAYAAGKDPNGAVPVEADALDRAVWTFLLMEIPASALADLGAADTPVGTQPLTASARALRDFIARHGADEADAGARAASALLFHLLATEAAFAASDFRLDELADGTPIVRRK